jgi:hypothetical protein
MSEFFKRIHKADRILSILGWLQVFAVFLAVCSAPWDHSALEMTANPWMKVIRYASALAIYAWTLALFIQHLPGPASLLRFIRWGTVACLAAETAALTLQAIRGVPSHYNTSGSANLTIFAVIGLAILFNTLIAFLTLFLFLWEEVDLPRAYLMGIRLGFVLFTIGSLEGMIMLINQAHTIGAADGGPGIAFLEWSTKAGDLRAAHLAGVFGIQIMPLAGYAIHRLMKDRKETAQLILVTAVAGLWTMLFMRLFNQAVAGRPILGA